MRTILQRPTGGGTLPGLNKLIITSVKKTGWKWGKMTPGVSLGETERPIFIWGFVSIKLEASKRTIFNIGVR